MTHSLQFEAIAFPEACAPLREEVRAFLATELSTGTLADRAPDAGAFSREFSKRLGEMGWLGMMWPKQYGGHERSALERYVVNEELLVAGVPMGAHFVADRQSGPLLLRFGTEEQRERILPGITRGETTFCIGMSEPNSGSDLASVQTSAKQVDGGWMLNGTKLWTSWAHKAQFMITLARTSPRGENKHEGLTQLMVELSSSGIEVRPIINLKGLHDFNEVVLTDCFVPDDMVVGDVGNGWDQVTSELAYERSGPERFLSMFRVVVEMLRAIGPDPTPHQAQVVGRLVSHFVTLRNMSISVAGMLQAGKLPNLEAALVKDLGTTFEQEIPEIARLLIDAEPSTTSDRPFELALAQALLHAPQVSIQGGTREILRVVIARGMGLQ
ncbi:MAG: acyl-CoA dehydrogenase family protein [Candidatus Hydrogenedentes bacterium]|nr:acyl-CoA dehydrogenase family protein [Candidatus Hydrogenedentota bacterium]